MTLTKPSISPVVRPQVRSLAQRLAWRVLGRADSGLPLKEVSDIVPQFIALGPQCQCKYHLFVGCQIYLTP